MVIVGDDDGIIIVTMLILESGRRWFNKNVYEMYYKYFVSVDRIHYNDHLYSFYYTLEKTFEI